MEGAEVSKTLSELREDGGYALVIDGWDIGKLAETVGQDDLGYNGAMVLQETNGKVTELWVTREQDPCHPDAPYEQLFPSDLPEHNWEEERHEARYEPPHGNEGYCSPMDEPDAYNPDEDWEPDDDDGLGDCAGDIYPDPDDLMIPGGYPYEGD